jgi:hypothetical protein
LEKPFRLSHGTVYPHRVLVPDNRNDQQRLAPIMTKPQAYFEAREFINLGFLMAQFTPEQLAPVIQEVRAIEANFSGSEKWNQNLAGQIQHEY